jgi:acetylornithine/N-succinyldiaminopimelate aminotransferase
MRKDILPFYISSDKLITKSKDCYLFDSEGKKYIDFESGVWCTNIGHGNKLINSRIKKQIRKIVHHGYHFRNQYAEQLSIKLQELIGFKNGASVFLSSGSEAVNLSITLARHFTGKKKVLKIDNSYLSAFGFGQITANNNTLVNVKYNDLDSVNKVDFSDISTLVLETGGASVEMVRFPENEFVTKLIDACQRNGCLIIAEEVTTGIGRLGKWFGFQHYDIVPDIVVAGKALGNGFPISSLTLNSNLADKFEHNPFRYGQSHQNDPFGCSVAIDVIKIIESNKLIDKSRITGDYFKKRLDQIQEKHSEKIQEIRARGLMLALEFKDSVDGELIHKRLFESGYVMGFRLNTLRFLPPLTIKHTDIDKMIEKLDEILLND